MGGSSMEMQKKQVDGPSLSEENVMEEAVASVAAPKKSINPMMLGAYAMAVALGIGTGYLLSQKAGPASQTASPALINTGKVAGVTDERTFKDSAEGKVEKGGINGEGTHKLIREGGESQTAFLISSVVDLDEYVGKKVKVWGQTFAAEKVAWLMDVGKIELLE